MSDSPVPHTCLALRLRRTVHEDAYVDVPIDDAILAVKPDGSRGIDFQRFVAEAVRLSADSRVEWKLEQVVSVEPNPVQVAAPEGRRRFDISCCPSSRRGGRTCRI